MSTMNLHAVTSQSRFDSAWNEIKHQFTQWRRRVRSRRELMSLSEADLRDIGVSRCTADFESSKPFWMN